MKIAYVLTTFPSHTETFAAREIDCLTRMGHTITILAANRDTTASTQPHSHPVFYRPAVCSPTTAASILFLLRHYPLGIIRYFGLILHLLFVSPYEAKVLLSNFHTLAWFARVLDDYSISILHAYFLSWPACITLALAKITGREFSIAAHARDIFVEPGALTLKATHARFIVTCTDQGLSHLKTRLPKHLHHKLHLTHHGIPSAICDIGDPEPRPLCRQFLAVGRLVPKKGFNILLQAFARIAPQLPHHKLLIVGDGPDLPLLRNMLAFLRLEDKVHLLGRKNHANTLELMYRSDALIVPSVIADDGDRDGIPNVILEAFAFEVPVIASRLNGITEAVIDGHTGLLVTPGDPHALASAILHLADNRQLSRIFAGNARQTLQTKFDLDENVGRLASLFRNTGVHPPLRIAHVSEPMSGGIATYFTHTLPALVRQGFDMTLICPPQQNPHAVEILRSLQNNGVTILPLPMTKRIHFLRDLQAFIRLCRLLASERFDIVHTHSSKAGVLARLAAFLTGTPVLIHTPHCFAFLRQPRRIKRLLYFHIEKFLSQITTCCIAVSHSEAAMVATLNESARPSCKVVFNALPGKFSFTYTSLKARLGIPPTTRVVSTFCRLVEGKGILRFLQAAQCSQAANTCFLIVGEGYLRSHALRFIKDNRLDHKVFLTGFLNPPDEAYAISDVVALCSDAEGQPYTLLEAMRATRAIVATSVPGNIELIRHNDTGLLTSKNPSDIASEIDRLLADEPLRRRLAQNAHCCFLQHHVLDDQIAKLTDIYKSLYRKKPQENHATFTTGYCQTQIPHDA